MARAKTTKSSTKAAANSTEITRSEPTAIRSLPSDVQEKIRARAYELWEQGGRTHGRADHDWLQAEREILGETAARKLA